MLRLNLNCPFCYYVFKKIISKVIQHSNCNFVFVLCALNDFILHCKILNIIYNIHIVRIKECVRCVCEVTGCGIDHIPHPATGPGWDVVIRLQYGVWWAYDICLALMKALVQIQLSYLFSLYLVIYAFAIQLLAVNLNLLKHFLNWIWQPVLTLVFKRSCPSLNRMSQNRLIFFCQYIHLRLLIIANIF